MQQFNLDTWLKDKSRKVVTRDGRPARIICWDAKVDIRQEDYHIIVLIDNGSHGEEISYFNEQGVEFFKTIDLFFADEEEKPQSIEIPFGAKDSEFVRDEYYIPEGCEARIEGNKVIIEKIQKEELTEFENTMVSFAHAMFDHLLDVTKEVNIKEWKDTLLDLAKKKLRKEQQEKLGTLEMPIDVTEPYYIKGKQDALKDLESLIEDKVAEKFAEFLKDLQTQLPLQPNPYNPNPFQPISVLYGCPTNFPDITYGTKTQQDNE